MHIFVAVLLYSILFLYQEGALTAGDTLGFESRYWASELHRGHHVQHGTRPRSLHASSTASSDLVFKVGSVFTAGLQGLDGETDTLGNTTTILCPFAL